MEKDRILIIDDESRIRSLLQVLMEKAGYEVTVVSGVDEGLSMLGERDYAVAMCDIKMPEKNGLLFLQESKKKFPDVEVIMLTGSDSIEHAIKAINLGATNYLLKPIDFETLFLAVKAAIEKRALISRDRQHTIWMDKKLEEQEKKISGLFVGAIKALVTSLEVKDKYTRGHSIRVAESSLALSKYIGLVKDIQEKINISASLHDIGKIGIKESVLNKPEKLTREEAELFRKHCVLGEGIVKQVIQDKYITGGIRNHHEWFNGKGYPDKLQKMNIPEGARIIGLADSFDAMVSDRPYRKPYSKKEAIQEIIRFSGTQFDPELAKSFIEMHKKGLL